MLQIDMITSEPKRMAEIADRSEDGADDRREGQGTAGMWTRRRFASANIDKVL